MDELPALGEVWIGADGLVEENGRNEDFEHVAAGDVERDEAEMTDLKVIEREVDAEIYHVAECEVSQPLAARKAEQDAQQEAVGGPHDGNSASAPAIRIEQGC